MDVLSGLIIAFGLIILANVLAQRQHKTAITVFEWALFFVNIPLILQGALHVFWPQRPFSALSLAITTQESGFILLGMGLWGALMSYRPFRRILARIMPIDPASPVHTLALILSGYLMANTLLALSEGALEALAETAESISITEFVLQQLLFAILAFLGVGLFLRRSSEKVQARLGLELPTRQQLFVGLRWIPLLVVLQWLVTAVWFFVNPEQVEEIGNVSNNLLGGVDSVWEWFALAIAAGIGEELLFRGALQPVLGMWFTAVLFAISHIQYGLTPATLAIFVIAIVLGLIRRRTNTTVAILVHFGYDFTIGLLALLATYLEPFVQ
ncbi:MAG: CPBP family intramembrane metalloprotease [Ardenticatenaceae bacterium]|nr:CPBP family intramembrane metalloprotease [Ardenticatenaceae bacterium]